MCLIIFAWKKHEDYKLVLTANRDEFYDRPSERIHFWKEHPEILAGKDLKEGGTWMGVTKGGRFAALTNYRDPKNIKEKAPTRGNLVLDFLKGTQTPKHYLSSLQYRADDYNGFNLLAGDGEDLYYYSNYAIDVQKIEPGVYGLSNSLIDGPWPKVEMGKKRLESSIHKKEPNKDELFDHLFDPKIYSDDELPDTGIPLEWERAVSAMHINKENHYGTVNSTVLLWNSNDEISYMERKHEAESKNLNEIKKEFKVMEPSNTLS
ncbi:MAG: NRDE family protein [Bacteroidota bacterium]